VTAWITAVQRIAFVHRATGTVPDPLVESEVAGPAPDLELPRRRPDSSSTTPADILR
jgi:hypothetical protein